MLAGNLLKLATLAAISTIAMAHSRMSKPIPRDPNGLGGQFSGSSIPNCEASRGQPKATYQRGQQIDINWARNNHYGGFIRLSIVPLANSDTNGIFDIPDNFEQFHCHESVCGPAEPLDPNGMFGGDPPGKNQPYQNTCSKTFTIPAHLADGEYTIQWLWYGGSNHYGKGDEMEGHYVTCHDFTVGGGAPYKPRPTGTCPVYKGGDVHQNGDKCLYLYETSPTCTVSSQTEDGDILWDCGGQTSNLKPSFGYPYPDLFKTCTKSTKKRSLKRNLNGGHGHGHGLTNITLYEEIEVVQGLDKYYS